MKVFTINCSDFRFGKRMVPSFYYYSTILKKENQKKGINYIVFEDIAEKISDGEHSHIPRQKERGIRYLYGRNIKEGIINFDIISDSSFITENDYNKFTRSHIKENDILITIYGTVGKSAIYKKSYLGIAGIPRHISNITLKDSSPLSPEFITAYLRSKIGKMQIESITTGNIQQLLSLKNLRKLDLPVPKEDFIEKVTKKEKEAIECEVTALSLINKARDLFYNYLNVNFDDVNKSKNFHVALSELKEVNTWSSNFYNPLFVNTEKLLNKNLPVVTLKEICKMHKGVEVGSNNYIKYAEKSDSDIPFIRTSDFVNFEVDNFTDYYVPNDIYEELDLNLDANDILFTKDGKIGSSALLTVEDKVILSSGILSIRLNENAKNYNLTPEYLFIVMSTLETGLFPARKGTVTASTIPHLREDRLKKIEVPLIDKYEIDVITKNVSDAFRLKSDKKRIIKEISNIIDSYFGVR